MVPFFVLFHRTCIEDVDDGKRFEYQHWQGLESLM